jgi:hypothetical protein
MRLYILVLFVGTLASPGRLLKDGLLDWTVVEECQCVSFRVTVQSCIGFSLKNLVNDFVRATLLSEEGKIVLKRVGLIQ